ncbi:MAG: hypothetical protein WAN43_00345 [Rhodomicrobium sp.]
MIFLLAVIVIILLVALLPEVAAALAMVALGALGVAILLVVIAVVIGLPVANPHEWWAYIPAAIIGWILWSIVWDVVFVREKPLSNKEPRPYDPNQVTEEQRLKWLREEEIENTAYELQQLKHCRDKEALELCNDYENYYVAELMSEDIKINFEDRLIAKAKAMREAEELRLANEEAEREAREREQLEREQKRLITRYGRNGVD